MSVVTGQFEIKRETAELNVIKWYEGCRCFVIRMVFRSCKGNLAVLRKSLELARDDPKRIYKNNIYKQGLDTTDLARDDPKRIL